MTLVCLQQAQVYYAGQSRYIGVFVSREEACIAYESVREKVRKAKAASPNPILSDDDLFNTAKKAAIESARKRGALGWVSIRRELLHIPHPTSMIFLFQKADYSAWLENVNFFNKNC